MTFLLYAAGLYCLADLFLLLRFCTRLKPSHFSLISSSFWSSGKSIIPLFSLAAILFWFFPLLSIALILFAKWPHPFLSAYRELKQKKAAASFPLSTTPTIGPKLFDIPTADKPHILFITLESFRAKNVGCLGAKLPLSPHFDELAKKGILFSNFHSTGNLTNRAIIASLFGIQPAHQPWHLGQYCNLPLIGLPHILSQHGYHPALIQGGSTAFDHEAEFFEKQGFKTILGKRDIPKPGTSWGIYDEHLMEFAAHWLHEQKTPVFLNLYTITNHHPWIHPQKTHGYLNTYAYTDWSLSLLIENLRKRNLLEKSILFIFGDHGQELEDRTTQYEINRHLTQDTLHVPLLIYAEGRIQSPQRIETVASQIDLLPTLMDMMNLSDAHQSLGKSLLRPSTSPIFFSHPFDKPIRGCREGNWKYLDSEELYDLGTDPEEKINRIAEGTPLKEKTEAFFEALNRFYSEQPFEKKESSLHLDFSNSLKMTDELLEEIAKKNPNLSSISLENCLLLTDRGIASLLQYCPKLEKLYLDGQDEITGANWGTAPHLVNLKALNCPQMTTSWISQLPNLRALQLGSSVISDDDLTTLAALQKNLNAIYFSGLHGITDHGLKPLLEKNENLMVLSLIDCPQITSNSVDSIKSKIFRYKFIR